MAGNLGQPDKRTLLFRESHMSLLRKILDRSRRALRAAGRHRADAAVDLDVLVRRCIGQIHRRDLFGRAIAVAARLRGAGRCWRRSIWRHRVEFRRLERPWLQLLRVPCFRRWKSRRSFSQPSICRSPTSSPIIWHADFRHGTVGDRAARACRLAALERGPDRVLRRADRAAPSAQTVSWPAMIALGGSMASRC